MMSFFRIFSLLLFVCISWFIVATDMTFADYNQFSLSKLPGEVIQLPDGSDEKGGGIVALLSLIQKILLKIVLPLVAVGCGIYIAYELFTADGDESKMKMAWSAIIYSIIALVSIALSALIIQIISKLNIG